MHLGQIASVDPPFSSCVNLRPFIKEPKIFTILDEINEVLWVCVVADY